MKSVGRPPRSGTPPSEQSAWAWVDKIQDPGKDIGRKELLSAYKLNFPGHLYQESKCKKNCKLNPKCYIGLGEHKWLERKKNEEVEEVEVEVTSEHRPNNVPAGLINLGNTCYVNSFLQIWFHNVWLREAIYRWNPVEDREECENETLIEGLQFKPKGKIGSLQALFALMEFSHRKALDPNDFISKLGLDPQVQQDAQEFSKLFMSLLESSLASQTNEKVKNVVQNQFCGEYAYITTCSSCGRESKRPSDFYELVLILQGKKTLLDCLQDFLSNEVLDGDNKYYCDDCDAKRDATRCVRLTKLPPVLNLSLNRFIFDMKTGTRKKLNSAVQFPEELDMSVYVGQEPGTSVYNLTGVLIHIGDNAHQGHYKAHIQELSTGQWFQFSDDVVESLEGMESLLGSQVDVDTTASSTPIKPKKTKSKNPGSTCAYMFVYTAKSALSALKNAVPLAISSKIAEESHYICNGGNKMNGRAKKLTKNGNGVAKTSEPEISNGEVEIRFPEHFPRHLKSFIEHDRAERKKEIETLETEQASANRERKLIQTHMLNVCSKIGFEGNASPNEGRKENSQSDKANSSFDFVPSEWLKSYISNPQTAPPMNTDHLQCFHGKLDLEKLSSVKAINSNIAVELYNRIGGINRGVRLDSESLCDQCVKNRCRQMILTNAIAGDTKLVADLLKEPVDESDGILNYWVGKQSLKRWRAIAKEELDEKIISETDLFCNDMPDLEPVNPNHKQVVPKNQVSPSNNDSAKFEEVESQLSSQETTIILNGKSQVKVDTSEITLTSTFQDDDDVIKSGNVTPEENTVPTRRSRRSNRSGGITVSDDWTSIMLTNSSETSQDLVLSIQRLSPPENPSNPDSLPTNGNAHSTYVSGNEDDSDEQMEIVASNARLQSSQLTESLNQQQMNNGNATARVQFNADLICHHGNLSIEPSRRRLVPERCWKILKKYFQDCKEFSSNDSPCIECERDLDHVKFESKQRQDFANAQKSVLSDVYSERNRPSWSKQTLNKVYLISRSFVNSWRHWLRNPTIREPLTTMGNEILLCEHKKLIYPLDLDTESDYESVVYMLSEEEWTNFCKFYSVDCEISVTRNRIQHIASNGGTHVTTDDVSVDNDVANLLSSSPPICKDCIDKKLQQELDDRLLYKDAVVYIRRLTGSEKPPEEDPTDPDFNDVALVASPVAAKRLKLATSGNVATTLSSVNTVKMSTADFVRRSSRKQKVRGEKEFHVSSDMLLRDLKVKIMRSFQVAPFDQNLCLNGLYLVDSSQTLAQLKVLPKSTIYLTVDEPNSGPGAEPECWPVHDAEEGFKGTGLVSSTI